MSARVVVNAYPKSRWKWAGSCFADRYLGCSQPLSVRELGSLLPHVPHTYLGVLK